MGGSSRIDVQSLVFLHPISILTCAIGAWTLKREHLDGRRWLIGGFLAVAVVAALHLVPFPNDLRRLVVNEDKMALLGSLVDVDQTWRPITATPTKAWQALISLFVPLAVLLLGIQLSRDDLYRLLLPIVGLGAFSGLLGLLQITGSPGGPLYFYRITNSHNAVGLFANRNHAAVLLACLFPMLAVLATIKFAKSPLLKGRSILAAALAIVLVPLILVTGSRSGLLITIVGLLGGLLMYRQRIKGGLVQKPTMTRSALAAPIIAAVATLCVGLVTILSSRAVAIDRFFGAYSGADDRRDFWVTSLAILEKYFPIGSGSGSFSEIFQFYEPTHLLDSTYLNQAHNDWIETVVILGAPGLILMLGAILLYIIKVLSVWRMDGNRTSVAFSQLASINLAMIAMASASDYPLRTPAFMALTAILILWFLGVQQPRSHDSSSVKYAA